MRFAEGKEEIEYVRVAMQDRMGFVIQWVRESTRPTGYLVDFEGVYMALIEEDLVAAE